MKNRKWMAVLIAGAVLALTQMVPAEETEAETEAIAEMEAIAETEAAAEMEAIAEEETEEETEAEFLSKEVPVYFFDKDHTSSLSLYCWSDAKDMPYIEMKELTDLMISYYQFLYGDSDFQLLMTWDDSIVELDRENGYSMLVDFDEGTISFDDYDGFLHISRETPLLDMVSSRGFDDEGNAVLFQRAKEERFDRYGSEIELNLNDYGINLLSLRSEEKYFIPLQTASDFLFSGSAGNLFYNGEAVFLANESCFRDSDRRLTELGEMYYDVEPREKSEKLAEYSYQELCLALDCFYGLKETHGITNFDRLFKEIGFKEDLLSTDPEISDLALQDFIHFYLDDLHSAMNGYSCYYTSDRPVVDFGYSDRVFSDIYDLYMSKRDEAEEDMYNYCEVGNTAYITFDKFVMDGSIDFYTDDIEGAADTVSLVINAHSEITRENSPIENVVIDLSCNTGGDVDACVYITSWLLGEAPLSIKNNFTGASSTCIYRADVNLDRKFDETDTVKDKNLYCLISPVSFSCGNTLAASLKDSQRVTLLGSTSGGGSCVVLELSTAYGSYFQISAPYQISLVKNGSYYNIDQGVDPDYAISDISHFYDRELLTGYINDLF